MSVLVLPSVPTEDEGREEGADPAGIVNEDDQAKNRTAFQGEMGAGASKHKIAPDAAQKEDASALRAENEELRRRIAALEMAAVANEAATESSGRKRNGDGDSDGGGTPGCESEHWALPEEIRARLERLFISMDQDKNGVLDAKERMRMREDVRMLCIEFGMGSDAFQRMPDGLSMEEFAGWFAGEWEISSKMQALVGTDILRAVVRAIPGGHPEFPLQGLIGMELSRLGRVCRTEVAAAIEAALASKREQVIQQEQRASRSNEGGFNHKFALGAGGVRTARFGGIEDFHKGIAAQVISLSISLQSLPKPQPP